MRTAPSEARGIGGHGLLMSPRPPLLLLGGGLAATRHGVVATSGSAVLYLDAGGM